MIDKKEIERYRENGFLVVPDVLSQEEVGDLRRVTDEFVENARHVSEHNEVYDLEPDHSKHDPRVRRIKNPDLRDPTYAATLRHPGILDIVDCLIGPGIRYQTTKLNMKSADFGSQVEWHQDWAFYPHTNDDILAVGIAMDDITPENGCLLVVPGSHRGPVRDHHENGVFVGAVTDGLIDPKEAVPVEVAAGGISIHHVRTLHASAPNHSANSRRMLLLELAAIDAWPLNGFGDWESFKGKVLRGKLGTQARLETVPVRMPEPKPARGGSIYEIQSQLSQPQMKGR